MSIKVEGTKATGESEKAATPAGRDSMPAPSIDLAKLNADEDIVDDC